MAIIKNASEYKNEHFIKKLDNIDVNKIVGKNITLDFLFEASASGQIEFTIDTIVV